MDIYRAAKRRGKYPSLFTSTLVNNCLLFQNGCPQSSRFPTAGQGERSSGNQIGSEPIRFVRLDSQHAQSDRKSGNRGLPVLEPARGRDFCCWSKGARPLGTRMTLSRKTNELHMREMITWLPKKSGEGCLHFLAPGLHTMHVNFPKTGKTVSIYTDRQEHARSSGRSTKQLQNNDTQLLVPSLPASLFIPRRSVTCHLVLKVSIKICLWLRVCMHFMRKTQKSKWRSHPNIFTEM